MPLLAFLGRSALARLFLFRDEAMTLWRAFRHPDTPLVLKGAMLFAALYLVSPIDLIPDFIPFAGWIDDLVLVPLLVSLIVRLLPPHIAAKPVRATVRRRY
jgi:uncharacterized membrane protein YkvA (DUF1232 family)